MVSTALVGTRAFLAEAEVVLLVLLMALVLALPADAAPWPHGEVPYSFDPSVPASVRAAVNQAARCWTEGPAAVSVREVPWSPWLPVAWWLGLERLWIRLDPNQSTFGETTLGAGDHPSLVINPAHTTAEWMVADLVHEWGHVWGLTHEHQRRDRDQYVVFPDGFLASLPPDRRGDYALLPGDPPPDHPRPYDYRSVMQYSANIDGNRMRRRDTGALLPQNTVPSPGDWKRLEQVYGKREP